MHVSKKAKQNTTKKMRTLFFQLVKGSKQYLSSSFKFDFNTVYESTPHSFKQTIYIPV